MLAVTGTEHIDNTAQVKNYNTRETFESTALSISSKMGHTKIVELLIGAKADVNKCDQVSKHRGFQFFIRSRN